MDDFDFEAPSFSLGIDLDDDTHADLVVDDSDPEPAADESFERNVRRRRLTTVAASADSSAAPSHNVNHQLPSSAADWNGEEEEEIEDFSSEEGDATMAQNQAMCSTSKISLPAQGSVIVKSIRKLQSEDPNEAPSYQTNHKGETLGDKFEIPRLTISPVRKFLLVDSDSDDFTVFVKKDTLPRSAKISGGLTDTSGKRSVKESSGGSQPNDDLWNDFVSPKRFTFSTPALDEVCEEYFHALKENNDGKHPRHSACTSAGKNITGKLTDLLIQQNPSIQGSIPPSHRYFFHNDIRIQNLVRTRLHNFYPLVDVLDNRGDDLLGTPNIDYRSQFNQGAASTSRKQTNQKRNVEGKSTKARRKNKRVVENVSQASESWVNPRVSASSSTPRDAGQRRVRGDGSSDGVIPKKMGHWFTGSDGKRVYVSASGKELTGRLAYMHYKKESGGFKKSRKKAAAKKT